MKLSQPELDQLATRYYHSSELHDGEFEAIVLAVRALHDELVVVLGIPYPPPTRLETALGNTCWKMGQRFSTILPPVNMSFWNLVRATDRSGSVDAKCLVGLYVSVKIRDWSVVRWEEIPDDSEAE